MPLRRKDQSIGLWLNEPIILAPGKLETAVRELAAAGFGIIRVMLRNTNLTHRSPVMVDAVRRVVATAHEEGVRVALDCEPHAEPVGQDMGELFPGRNASRLVPGRARVVDGQFVVHFKMPDVQGQRADFLGVEAAFFRRDDGAVEHLQPLPFQLLCENEHYAVGYTLGEQYYTEGRAVTGNLHAHLSGDLGDRRTGELIVYARYSDRKRVDFWSEDCWNYFDLLLECYRDIPLDGVGWDEPAVAGNWFGYHWGQGYAAAFERLNGYALTPRLYLLDTSGMDAESSKVRLDYYRTLNEGAHEAQRRLISRARELFGPELLLGTHHTWQGEGGINDYRAGAVDYFRLNDNMDAGYTDCCWWDPRSVAYAYTLASSLGRLTPSGEAEVNTWSAKPTNSQLAYNARLITLMDITWFNIWYGEATDTCLYPAHYTWPAAVRETQRHHRDTLLLGGARPVVEVAIWHGWEGVCALNRADYAGAHKAFCLNVATLFIERSVPFDWVDSRLLAASAIEDDILATALGRYRVLVLPYASVLPVAAWEKCCEFARAGGKLVFVGPPPELDDAGGSLREGFAALLEMEPFAPGGYVRAVDARYALPSMRPERLDVHYPLPGGSERIRRSIENEAHGIANARGNVVYLTDLDPQTRLLEVLEPWLLPTVVCHSDSMLWRLYRRGSDQVLVLAARKDRKLGGIVQVAGHVLEFSDGLVALVELSGSAMTVHGEGVVWKQRGIGDAVLY